MKSSVKILSVLFVFLMSSYTYAALFQDPVKKVEKKDIKVKPNKSYKKRAEKAVPMKKD